MLAELLLEKGYIVHGLKRRSSSFNTGRVDHLYVDRHEADTRFFMHYGELTDAGQPDSVSSRKLRPDEIYNLAAQSHVQVSFETPEYTANADGVGTLRLLEAIRILAIGRTNAVLPSLHVGNVWQGSPPPPNEETPFHPRAPHGAAKLYAHWITINYRQRLSTWMLRNGILFNHEGPTRGETFVTRKITRAVAAIEAGRQKKLYLGNLDAERDWGHGRGTMSRVCGALFSSRSRMTTFWPPVKRTWFVSSSNGPFSALASK